MSLPIVCPHCQAINRAPEARFGAEPKCGVCHRLLFSARPAELSSTTSIDTSHAMIYLHRLISGHQCARAK